MRLWYERFLHVNIHALIKTSEVLADKKFVVDKKDNFFCESWVIGKQARKPHTSVKHTSNFKVGEKIHTMSVAQLALNIREVLDISFYSRMTVRAFEKYIS